MSGPMPSRFDVVASTRRKFTAEQKEAMLAEIEAGAPVSEVARRHSVSSSLLFRWRRDRAKSAWKSREAAESSRFLPVRIAPPAPLAEPASGLGGCIELVLVNGRRLRIGMGVEITALTRIVAALEA